LVYTRWVEQAGWELTRVAFFDKLAPPMKWIVPHVARRGLIREMHGHGMGRHSAEQILAIGCRDISALADFLGDKSYFMGHQPCTVDASVYAFLANLLWAPVESALKVQALQYPQLQAYCERMRGRYYS
jgi:glutathione S-transferase